MHDMHSILYIAVAHVCVCVWWNSYVSFGSSGCICSPAVAPTPFQLTPNRFLPDNSFDINQFSLQKGSSIDFRCRCRRARILLGLKFCQSVHLFSILPIKRSARIYHHHRKCSWDSPYFLFCSALLYFSCYNGTFCLPLSRFRLLSSIRFLGMAALQDNSPPEFSLTCFFDRFETNSKAIQNR